MSSFHSPQPHSADAGQAAASHDAMPENDHPTQPTPSIPAQRPSDPAEQTAQTSEHPQQERSEGTRTKPGDTPVPMKPITLSFDVDVERRGLDPFVIGVAIGAIAAIVGLLVGLYVILVL